MRDRLKIIGASLVILLGACGAAEQGQSREAVMVRPDEFALRPCASIHQSPCALVVAGGKRILFGAPAGVAQSQTLADLSQLDAMVVFSLTARDLEGVDEVRNVSWHAGRTEPLLVIGPTGIEDVVTALNKAFEQSDALYVVEHGIPAGGYDAAVLTARVAQRESLVFDTGDLSVTRADYGYRIAYRADGKTSVVALQECQAEDELVARDPTVERHVTIACAGDEGDHNWPLRQTVFIVKN